MLNEGILLVGIVVECAQAFLRILIICNVVLEVLIVVIQHPSYVHGQCQTDVAVGLGALVKKERGHRRQGVDE